MAALGAKRRAGVSGAVAVDDSQPDRLGQGALAGAVEAVATNPSRGGPPHQGGLEGRGLGAFVWAAMTGARRGELCALGRQELELDAAALTIRAGLKRVDGRLMRRDTKTHQQRRVALDTETLQVITGLIERRDAEAAELGVTIGPEAFLFSQAPDASAPLTPGTATQRMAAWRAGWASARCCTQRHSTDRGGGRCAHRGRLAGARRRRRCNH